MQKSHLNLRPTRKFSTRPITGWVQVYFLELAAIVGRVRSTPDSHLRHPYSKPLKASYLSLSVSSYTANQSRQNRSNWLYHRHLAPLSEKILNESLLRTESSLISPSDPSEIHPMKPVAYDLQTY